MPMKFNPITAQFDLVMGPGSGTATIQFDADSGSAVPTAGGVITITGGTGITTSATGTAVTFTLDTPVTVANGGTGQSTYTDGQLLIGNTTGNTLSKSTLTGGSGITITNAGGTITIDTTGGGFTWSEVTGTSQSMEAENGYIANNVALVTLTLPATASVGDEVQVVGKGTGLFKIAQNDGQTIHFIANDTTPGVGGSLTAIEQYAALELICITEDTDWAILDSAGNFTRV
jgi:hypothetical protein